MNGIENIDIFLTQKLFVNNYIVLHFKRIVAQN